MISIFIIAALFSSAFLNAKINGLEVTASRSGSQIYQEQQPFPSTPNIYNIDLNALSSMTGMTDNNAQSSTSTPVISLSAVETISMTGSNTDNVISSTASDNIEQTSSSSSTGVSAGSDIIVIESPISIGNDSSSNSITASDINMASDSSSTGMESMVSSSTGENIPEASTTASTGLSSDIGNDSSSTGNENTTDSTGTDSSSTGTTFVAGALANLFDIFKTPVSISPVSGGISSNTSANARTPASQSTVQSSIKARTSSSSSSTSTPNTRSSSSASSTGAYRRQSSSSSTNSGSSMSESSSTGSMSSTGSLSSTGMSQSISSTGVNSSISSTGSMMNSTMSSSSGSANTTSMNSTSGESLAQYSRRLNNTQFLLGGQINRTRYSKAFLKKIQSTVSNKTVYFDSCSSNSPMPMSSYAVWMQDPNTNMTSLLKYTLCPADGLQPRMVTQFNLMKPGSIFGSKSAFGVGYTCGKNSLDQTTCNARTSVDSTGCRSGIVLLNIPFDGYSVNATISIITVPQAPSSVTLCA